MTRSYQGPSQIREGPDSNSPAGHAKAWLVWLLEVRGRSQRTFDGYGVILRQWLAWAEEQRIDPLMPTITELEAFVGRPRIRQGKGRPGAPATRRQDVVILKGWFGWLAQRGLVGKDPTVDLYAPSVPTQLPKPVPDGHWLQLWQSPRATPRLHLALGAGYFLGLRRKEIASLRGGQVRDDRIWRFVRKGGGEDTLDWRAMLGTYVELLPQLAPGGGQWGEQFLAHARDVGTEGRMFWTDGQQMYKAMVRLCDAEGVPHYTPHQLRHSCATNLLRAGVPIHLVMRLLNHSSMEITMRYVKAGSSELDEWRRSVRASAAR